MLKIKDIAIRSSFVLIMGIISTGVSAQTISFGNSDESCLSNLGGDQSINGGYTFNGGDSSSSADGLTRKIIGYASTFSPDCDQVDNLSQQIWITNDYGKGIYVIDSSNVISGTNTSFIDYTLVYTAARIINDNALPTQNSNYPHCLIVGRNASHNGVSVSSGGWVVDTTSYRNRCTLTADQISSTVGGNSGTGGPDDED